jgi:hypothetical protein
MRKTTVVAIAASSLILAGFAGWASPYNPQLQAKASGAFEAQIDTFGMMASARDLPDEEFQETSRSCFPRYPRTKVQSYHERACTD